MGLEVKYFVLKPRGDSPHAYASRAAMLAYAEVIATEDQLLAETLKLWAQDEENAVIEKLRAKKKNEENSE